MQKIGRALLIKWWCLTVGFSTALPALSAGKGNSELIKDYVVEIILLDSSGYEVKRGSGLLVPSQKLVYTTYNTMSGAVKAVGVIRTKKSFELFPCGYNIDKNILVFFAPDIVTEIPDFTVHKSTGSNFLKVWMGAYISNNLSIVSSDIFIPEKSIETLYGYYTIKTPIIGDRGGAVAISETGNLLGITNYFKQDNERQYFVIPFSELSKVSLVSTDSFNMARTYLLYKAINHYFNLQYDSAFIFFNRFIEKGGKDPYAYYYRGYMKFMQGDVFGSITDYRLAIQLDSTDGRFYQALANSAVFNHDAPEAFKNYNKAISLIPGNARAYSGRAYLNGVKHNVNASIADYDTVLMLQPDNANAYCDRGYQKTLLNLTESAVHDFDKALSINNRLARAYYYRGTERGKNTNYDGALQDLNDAIRWDSSLTIAYINRANIYNLKTDYVKAYDDCTVAIKRDSTLMNAYYTRSVASFYLGNQIDALQDLNKVIAKEKNNTKAVYQRALVKIALGDKIGGCTDLSKAGEMGMYDVYKLIRENCN